MFRLLFVLYVIACSHHDYDDIIKLLFQVGVKKDNRGKGKALL